MNENMIKKRGEQSSYFTVPMFEFLKHWWKGKEAIVWAWGGACKGGVDLIESENFLIRQSYNSCLKETQPNHGNETARTLISSLRYVSNIKLFCSIREILQLSASSSTPFAFFIYTIPDLHHSISFANNFYVLGFYFYLFLEQGFPKCSRNRIRLIGWIEN